MSEIEQPKTLGKKIENLWYHYKPFIVIGVIALVIIVVCTVQACTRKKQDIIVYRAASGVSEMTLASQDDFRCSAALIAKDYNGDGKVIIDYKEDILVPNELSQLGQPTTSDRFNIELATGECVVYIMDDSFYRGNREFMCDLADVMETVPAYAFDEKAFRLGDLPAYRMPGIRDIDPDSYVCLRIRRKGMSETEYEYGRLFFNAFVTYYG